MRHPVPQDQIFQGSRVKAKELDYLFYETGKPCPHGHYTYRRVSDCQCMECAKINNTQRGRKYRARHPMTARLATVRSRCEKRGLELDENAYREAWRRIPTHCPVLGVKLATGVGENLDNSPEMDRLDPAKGYVEGNMRVISRRANRLKNDGTAEEHRLIYEWTKEQMK